MRFRWVILAAGTFSQATYTAVPLGMVVLAPTLRSRYGLSLTQIGVILAAPNLGAITTLYAWGIAADRFGERAVIGAGLAMTSVCMAALAFVGSFWPLTILLLVACALGAGVNSASGRVVLHWFGAGRRGMALGVRQTAVPIAGVWVAAILPVLVAGDDPRNAILSLAAGCLVGGLVGFFVIREGPLADHGSEVPHIPVSLRDRRMWLLYSGSGLIIAPQVCLLGFFVVFLHDRRDLSTSSAAAVLAVVNILGIATRIAAGHWSDVAGSRIGPMRQIALASTALVVGCALLVSSPIALLVPVLVVMGCVSISWNGLSTAAAAEAAGHARSGAALGIQQTVLAVSGAALPIAFGAIVAAFSWRAGFAVVALFPLAGWRLLATVPG